MTSKKESTDVLTRTPKRNDRDKGGRGPSDTTGPNGRLPTSPWHPSGTTEVSDTRDGRNEPDSLVQVDDSKYRTFAPDP